MVVSFLFWKDTMTWLCVGQGISSGKVGEGTLSGKN